MPTTPDAVSLDANGAGAAPTATEKARDIRSQFAPAVEAVHPADDGDGGGEWLRRTVT